jgi:hypothetical protein
MIWDSVIAAGLAIIDKVIPDPVAKQEAQFKLLQLQQAGEFKAMDNELAMLKTQTDINLEQAKSSDIFVSGPRPFLMWVGGVGVAYQWILVPLASFAYTTYTGLPLPVQPPVMDPNLMVMLGGLMGLQIGARTYEKTKGVAS